VGTQRSTVNLWSGRRCIFFSNPQLHGTGSFLVLSFDGTAFVHTVKLALIYFVHNPLSQITRDGGWLTSLISTQIHRAAVYCPEPPCQLLAVLECWPSWIFGPKHRSGCQYTVYLSMDWPPTTSGRRGRPLVLFYVVIAASTGLFWTGS
jgi:hypothetical protein